MLNLIRADLYRLVRGKTLWVTTGIATIFYILAGTGKFTPRFRTTIGSNQFEQSGRIISGSQAPYSVMASPEFLIYFFLPLLIVVACTDFSTGVIKNTLSKGSSRLRFYFSKLLLAYLIGTVFELLQVALPLISGTIVLGFGQPLSAGYFEKLTEVFLLQLPLFLGVISIGIFLIFLTRRAAIASVVYLGLFAAAQLLGILLKPLSDKFGSLLRYEILYCLRQAASLQPVSAQDIVRIVSLGTGYMIMTTLLGILVFQKSDIK